MEYDPDTMMRLQLAGVQCRYDQATGRAPEAPFSYRESMLITALHAVLMAKRFSDAKNHATRGIEFWEDQLSPGLRTAIRLRRALLHDRGDE